MKTVMMHWLDTDAARADLTTATIAFTKSHNGLLPVNFAELKENLPTDSPTRLLDDDQFVFMVDTPIKRDAPAKGGFDSGKILFRERTSRQKLTNLSGPPDEVKIYGFTDGSVAEISADWLKVSKLGSFDDWEKNHLASTQ